MALSGELLDDLPYSSWHESGNDFSSVIKNYSLRVQDILGSIFHETCESLMTKEQRILLAGNYSFVAWSMLALEFNEGKEEDYLSLSLRRIENHLRDVNFVKTDNKYLNRDLAKNPNDETVLAKLEHNAQLLQTFPQYLTSTVLPLFHRLNQINREHYDCITFKQTKIRLMEAQTFDDVAYFITNHGFFHFCCYATRYERIQIVELIIRRGRELSPQTLPDLSFDTILRNYAPENVLCLWTIIQLDGMVKRSGMYNFRLHGTTPFEKTRLLQLFKQHLAFRDKRKNYSDSYEYERVATDFLEKWGQRTFDKHAFQVINPVVIEMSHVYSLRLACGRALAMSMHKKCSRFFGKCSLKSLCLISMLNKELLLKIWSFVRDDIVQIPVMKKDLKNICTVTHSYKLQRETNAK